MKREHFRDLLATGPDLLTSAPPFGELNISSPSSPQNLDDCKEPFFSGT